MLRETPAGLYCEAGDFHIHPWGPVQRALITHAHGHHARAGSASYLRAEPCAPLLARHELIALIGTTAKSGTRELVDQLKAGASAEGAIGQFGVGFYSAFMVTDRVEIVTRKAGAHTATRWEATGDGTYMVSGAQAFPPGHRPLLHLKPVEPESGLADYTSSQVLRSLVKETLRFRRAPDQAEGGEGRGPALTIVNSMKPIWTQAASEVSAESYAEFYRHLAHDWQDPLDRVSLKAEGRLRVPGAALPAAESALRPLLTAIRNTACSCTCGAC